MGELGKCWFMEAPEVSGSFAHPNQFVAVTGECSANLNNAFPCCAGAAESALQSGKPELVQAAQDALDRLKRSHDQIAAMKAVALERELENHH